MDRSAFVTKNGFPLYNCKFTSLASTIMDLIIQDPKPKTNIIELLSRLESPVDPIIKLVKKVNSNK